MTIETTSTALATRPAEPQLPSSYQEVAGLAKAFAASGMFSDIKQISQAIVKIQAGRELGLPPVYSMQNINMIRNRLTSSANTLALLVKKSGRYDYRIRENSDKICTVAFYEKDENGRFAEVGTSSFTMEDAKRADLIKPDSGWAKYPRAMLFSRAISQGARMYAPDAIGGVYTDEEIRSIPPRPNDTLPVTANPETGEIVDVAQVQGEAAQEAVDPLDAAIPRAEALAPAGAPDMTASWVAFVTRARNVMSDDSIRTALGKAVPGRRPAMQLGDDLMVPPANLTPDIMDYLDQALNATRRITK